MQHNLLFIVFNQNQRGRSSKELSALKQEADIHQNLRHPNIIQLLSSFDTEKELVFVCEYAVSDLHKLLGKVGSLGEPRTQKLSYDLISALYYLHSHRILHRDLKPPNILLDKNYKAKLCDFGLARNMTLGTQILTSIKGTPLYMAPELLEGRGYGYETDLWSLGCIIYEMLAGESPFNTRSILHLMKLIKYSFIKWPTFLSTVCISFLKGLLVNNPRERMSWDEILSHEFVAGKILILSGDQVSDSPFTRPRAPLDQQKNDKLQHAVSIARISQLKKQDPSAVEDINVMSSYNSVKVNLNLQSDIEETDNEDLAMLKNDFDGLETSCEGAAEACELPEEFDEVKMAMMMPGQFHNMHQFQMEPPRIHNITNFQPVAENSNMVMHRFMDNLDPELQTFMMTPAMMMMPPQCPMFPPVNPVQKITQDLDNFSIRMEKSVEVPIAQTCLRKSQKTQSDDVSTDVSSVPVETEEWLQFLFKAMQEILLGDLEIYKQDNMITMIVGLLRNPKFNSKLLDYVVQIISLPYAIDMPRSILEDIDKIYIHMKLVPNLIYASNLLCSKKIQQNSMVMSIPKVDKMVQFTDSELKSLSSIYDLVVFLVHSDEIFVQALCDAISVLKPYHLFRSFIANGLDGESSEGVRLTASIISLISAVLKDLPEHTILIENIIFHDDVDLCKLLRHNSAIVRLRTIHMLRLLGRFCCFSLQNQWNHEMSSCLEELMTDVDDDVKNETFNIIEEFKECVGWFKIENF